MSESEPVPTRLDPNAAPPARRDLQILMAIFLIIPLLALIPVGWYSREDPKLGSFPFFFWYQMLWVFLTAICTSIAYALSKKARPRQPIAERTLGADDHQAGEL